MPPDEKHPIAENEATNEVEQNAPITDEQLAAQMERLAEQAKAAGLNPIKIMVQTYAKKGRAASLALLDGLLGAIEDDDTPKKKN